jgi:cyclopropane-fatty-acyl-phospholipid synthase
MSLLTRLALSLTDRGVIPDAAIRRGIQHLVRQRLEEISFKDEDTLASRKTAFILDMAGSGIALNPEKANTQHYEVPTEFFQKTLGPHLKYSSGFWRQGGVSLVEAE